MYSLLFFVSCCCVLVEIWSFLWVIILRKTRKIIPIKRTISTVFIVSQYVDIINNNKQIVARLTVNEFFFFIILFLMCIVCESVFAYNSLRYHSKGIIFPCFRFLSFSVVHPLQRIPHSILNILRFLT